MMSFTSAYISKSMGHSIDTIGPAFDQLESVKGAAEER
jgi:hypothetical protein